jgi:hypothetical protein
LTRETQKLPCDTHALLAIDKQTRFDEELIWARNVPVALKKHTYAYRHECNATSFHDSC